MCERHSSIHSHVKDDGDEKLLRLITTHEQQQESVSINTVNEASETLDSTDKKESETEPLLDEIMVAPQGSLNQSIKSYLPLYKNSTEPTPIPLSERSTVPPLSQAGSNFGIIITTPLMSITIEEYFLGGWPSAFYVFGMLSCLWFTGWCRFGYNSPDQHPLGIGAFDGVAYCILFNDEEQPGNRTSEARERNDSIASRDT
ncbi:unnamed protein product [Rotaria socialis]|uniref:Uncharacterized protein n=1 Tax=Rotaria socialis TaxID=392032 RepID=A0A821C6L2_9BILA|nr:unnamed protein product [Rotaria socialis]